MSVRIVLNSKFTLRSLFFQDRPVLTFKRGEVLTLPIKRKKSRVHIEPQVASKLLFTEIKNGVNLCSVTGHLDVKDNHINIEVTF